jgi:hypothetical protein
MSLILPLKVMSCFPRVPTKLQVMRLILAINSPLSVDLQSSKFRCLQKDARLLDGCIVILQIIIANSLPIFEGKSEV